MIQINSMLSLCKFICSMNDVAIKFDLLRKYNVPGPRYTSYPTVPYWNEEHFSLKDWKSFVKKAF
jgi:hypothetical protein